MDLNDEQQLAAYHPIGEAALLLAGAGSGKTTTITERISWLISQGVPSRKILAITFTNRGAGAIREKVLAKTGLPEDQAPHLTTIHSLALRFIRRNPQGFGLGDKISPIDDWGQNELLKKIIEREKIEGLNHYNLRDQISYHRARGVGFRVDYTPEVHKRALNLEAGLHTLTPDDLKVWGLFEIEKRISNTVDFDDMIALVNQRAKVDPVWLSKLQGVFDHVLLDECQDTSKVAWEFITNLLGPSNRNLMITGDLSQSIYSFNGSSPKLIMDFVECWRDVTPKLYRLQRNHRSVPEIVTLANAIQAKMTTNTLPMVMVSFRGLQGEKGKASLVRADTPYDIARKITAHIVNSGRPLKDFAILVRSALQIREIEGELVRSRIPYVIRGGRGLLQTEEVRDVLSYIRLATNPNDSTAMSRAIAAPKRGVGDVALETLRTKANVVYDGNLLDACQISGVKLAGFANIIRAIQGHTTDPVRALSAAINMSGYLDHIKKKYAKEKDKIEAKIENLERLKLMIEGLVVDSDMTTEDVVFQLTMEKADKEDENGVVTISTIHAAKGLEWEEVFVVSVTESSIPHWRSSVGDEEAVHESIDEERRVFFVAVTRARDKVIICVPEQIQKGQYMSPVRQSRFLTEIGIPG